MSAEQLYLLNPERVVIEPRHFICIGLSDEHREGRYVVTTFRCAVCGRETRTLVERPTRWQRFVEWVAA